VDGDSLTDRVREVYVRDAFSIGRSHWTLGVRHTDGSLWGAATNPSFGTRVQLSDRVSVQANLARGVCARRGFKDIRYTFTNVSGGYEIIGNADLRPESVMGVAPWGASWAASTALGVDVEWYHTSVDDLIDTRFQRIGGVWSAELCQCEHCPGAHAGCGGHTARFGGRHRVVGWV
jgi:outer membrane cobalamin receptor